MSIALTSRAIEPEIIAVTCIDGEEHSEGCRFVTYGGVLPCNCDDEKAEYTWWWECWLTWNSIRVEHGSHQHYRPVHGQLVGPGSMQLPWPVKGADESPWIPGRDFNDAPYEG